MAAAVPPPYPMSPPRSPSRLPSPPPPTEDFTGPQSPSIAGTAEDANKAIPPPSEETASRRIRPGTKAADMAEGPPLLELADIDSAFQLTEHLKALYQHYTHPDSDTTVPLSKADAALLATPPPGIDRALWLYELCRFLVQKINSIITSLFADTPPCSSTTCPEMRASEWQYLCAVHDPPKPCCAIDYCCHTLDWAANVLTSPKHFPSRLALTIANETSTSPPSASPSTNAPGAPSPSPGSAPQHQVRQLINISRRVYRIFAHAWFQHREMFWRVESKTGLYIFFKTVCDVYNLIPADNYTIPAEAEGEEADAADTEAARQAEGVDHDSGAAPPPSILRRPVESAHIVDASAASNTVVAPGARRHRRSLSKTVPTPVETVVEEAEGEEEEEDVKSTTPDTIRPPMIQVTETQLKVPQAEAAEEETDDTHAQANEFPDFDDEEDEAQAGVEDQRYQEVGEPLSRERTAMPGDAEGAGMSLPERFRTDQVSATVDEEAGVQYVQEQAQAPAADADAATESVQD